MQFVYKVQSNSPNFRTISIFSLSLFLYTHIRPNATKSPMFMLIRVDISFPPSGQLYLLRMPICLFSGGPHLNCLFSIS